jgi:hypothetical protein
MRGMKDLDIMYGICNYAIVKILHGGKHVLLHSTCIE